MWYPTMKRPKQHQIEEKAYDQFKSCLPIYWVVRNQTHDYGIDREVEIFNQNANGEAVSTGYIFKAQVKGTEDANASKKGDLIKFQLEVDRTNYLCNDIDVPVFFILADVKSSKTWWYPIQLDRDLKQKLVVANKEEQKTITLNIPTQNILPDTLKSLVATLDDIKMSHACDSFVELPQRNFDNLSLSLDEIAKLEKEFTDKVFVAKITKLWQSRNYEGLEKTSRDALSNVSSSTATKVSAILCIENACENKIKESPILQAQRDKLYFKTAVAIKEITKDENKSWRLFSAIIWRAALLQIASSDDFALYLNNKMRKGEKGADGTDETDGFNYICDVTLLVARQHALKKVFRAYNQCLRLITMALNLEEYWMIPQVTLRVARALPSVFIHLWGEQLEETATLLRDHFNNVLRKTVAISFALGMWDDAAQLVYAAFTLNSQKDKKQYQDTHDWAIKTLGTIPDESRRKVWIDHLNDTCKMYDPERNKIEIEEPDIPMEEEYQIYIQTAQAMGINLDDSNDRIAQIVNIGLRDYNPERVLKNCKHLFVYIGHYGIPAEMLKLYTAGSKYLRCLKKDVAMGGQSLDVIYDLMKQEHCKGCEYVDPWPNDWKWTRSWQNTESEKETHKKFRERLNRF